MAETEHTDPLEEIARGGNPVWQETFEHPKYGQLTFRVSGLPDNADWLRHSVRTDQLIIAAGGRPGMVGGYTALYATSLAAIPKRQVDEETGEVTVIPGIFDPIVLEEKREEDPESGHVKIERVFYDAIGDDDQAIAMQAWTSFMEWRNKLLTRGGELGNSSGETPGSDSDASSLAPTGSPSTIPA